MFFSDVARLIAPAALVLKRGRIWLAPVALAILSACSQTSVEHANSSATPGAVWVYPAGVTPPINPDIGAAHGVYASQGANCCFLAQTASFEAIKPLAAKTAEFALWVPDIPYIHRHGQTISAEFDGVGAGPPVQLHPGAQTISFALPKAVARDGKVHIRLNMSTSYVPKALGMNGDIRRLSLILVSVGFK